MDASVAEQTYLGKVTQVIDPSNFWMHIGTDESLAEFLQFEINMEHSCLTMGSSVDRVEDIGQLVLVNCTDSDRMWRRGRVSRVDRESEAVDVLYIDYGDTELVKMDRLCVTDKDFFSFPIQALRCCLAGIKPIAKNWTSRATKQFQEIVLDEVLQTVMLGYQAGSLKVSLYTNHGDDGVAVSYMMLDQELGMPTDDDVPRLFVDSPKHFSPDTGYSEGEYSMWGMPVYIDGSTGDEAWPDSAESAPEQSHSSESQHLVNYASPISAGEPTDDESWPKAEGHSNDSGDEADHNEDSSDENNQVPAIPGFDFGQIQKTKNTSTDKLEEKKLITRHYELEAENVKIKEDMEEQSALTAAAGSGRHVILTYSSDEEEGSRPMFDGKFSDDIYNTNANSVMDDSDRQDKENKPAPIVVEGKKKTKEVYKIPPRFQKKRTNSGSPSRHRDASPGVGQSNKENYSSDILPNMQDYTAVHWSGEIESQNDLILKSKEPKVPKYKVSPRFRHKNTVLEPLQMPHDMQDQSHYSGVKDVEILPDSSDDDMLEMVKLESIAALEQTSPSKVDFHRVLNQIFAGLNKEDEDVTASKLRKLFATDLFVYLDTDQLQEVINILLMRAVRYYGDIHDCLLEIIELLNVAQDFPVCIVAGIKKIHDMFIKVVSVGSVFSVQCSKLLGHILNLSLFWNDSAAPVQKCILDFVERWVYFNKKGTQSGQEELEQIYLDSFKTIWSIIGDVLRERFPEKHSSIQWECREKLFGDSISRSVKEQLLDMYINCFVVPMEKLTLTVACQTSPSPRVAHTASQTDPPRTETPTFQSHQDIQKTHRQLTRDDPYILMTPLSFESGTMTPTAQLMTPQSLTSMDSSAYFTPDESPFTSEFPPLIQSPPYEGRIENGSKSWADLVGAQSSTEREIRNRNHSGQSEKLKETPVPSMQEQKLSTVEKDNICENELLLLNEPEIVRNISPLNVNETMSTIGKYKEGQPKGKNKTVTETVKDGKKESTKRRDKKGSVPLLRYGLATSVQSQPNTGQSDQSVVTAQSDKKNMDLKSIMDDFMNSYEGQKYIEGTLETECNATKKDAKKTDEKSPGTSTPMDWWMSAESDENEYDIVDLGWSGNHSSDEGEVLLNSVNVPGDSQTNPTYTPTAGKLSGHSTAQEDNDIEWETDEKEENDETVVAAILKQSAGNARKVAKQPVRTEQPIWQPGVRKCTICGEESHTIYECPQKHKDTFF